MPEEYIGDAVYASIEQGMLKLRTGDGQGMVIYLEPEVYEALERYVARYWRTPLEAGR